MRNRPMTAAEKKAAKWVFAGQFSREGRVWIEQRDQATGKRRFVSEVSGGKMMIRYGSIN